MTDSQSYPVTQSALDELDRAIGIFGRATTETHLDPSDRYDAIKHVRDYLLGLRESMHGNAQVPMRADIAQMIDAGWKTGKSSSEVAEEILREFDASSVSSTDREAGK